MIPGELFTDEGEHDLNTGRRTLTLVVQHLGAADPGWLALPLCRDQRCARL
jgi:hypothetical protein